MGTAFLIGETVLAGLVFIFNLLGINIAVSVSFAASFVVLLAYVVLSGVVRKTDMTLLFLILISGVNVVINGAMNGEVVFSFDYIKKLIFFYTSIIFFQLVTKVEIKAKIINPIKYIILIISCFLVFDYFILGNRAMRGRYLTLGFTNPNFTAMWLLHLSLFLVYFFFMTRSIPMKLFCGAVFSFMIFVIFETKNRSTLVVFVFFFLMLSVGALRKKYTLSNITLFLILVFPFLFFAFYNLLVGNSTITDMFQFAISTGKELDSRTEIWDYASGLLINNGWIIGDYASLHVNNSTGMLQMHNSHLDVLVSYGIVPFVLFLKFHYSLLKKVNKRVSTFPQFVAFCAFLSVIILGTFEAGIYSGCTGLNFLSGALLLIASYNGNAPCESHSRKVFLPSQVYDN